MKDLKHIELQVQDLELEDNEMEDNELRLRLKALDELVCLAQEMGLYD